MVTKKAQRKAGVGDKRRGQQMGDERSPNSSQQTKSMKATAATPALSGRRKAASKFYGDESSAKAGGDATRPRTVSPSVAGAAPTGTKLGESGGEAAVRRKAKRSQE